MKLLEVIDELDSHFKPRHGFFPLVANNRDNRFYKI